MKRMVFKPYEPADKSYGAVYNDTTSEYTLLNYQTAVATSFQTLEDDITKQYPNLKRAPKQDLRSYVKLLQSQFPKLTDAICDNYIKTYELARFSDHEWTGEMFEEWYGFLREFTDALALTNDSYPLNEVRSPLVYQSSQPTPVLSEYTSESDESYVIDMKHDDFD